MVNSDTKRLFSVYRGPGAGGPQDPEIFQLNSNTRLKTHLKSTRMESKLDGYRESINTPIEGWKSLDSILVDSLYW